MGKDNSDNINNSIDNQHLRLIPCSNGQTNVGDNNLHQNIDSTDSTHGNLVHNDSIQQGSFNNLSNVIQMVISRRQLQDIFNRQFELTALINSIINKKQH
nr:7124_t:CDS:2 [Entrophospora candida]